MQLSLRKNLQRPNLWRHCLNYYSLMLFVCHAIHKIETVFSSADSKLFELLLSFLKRLYNVFKTCIRCFSLRREELQRYNFHQEEELQLCKFSRHYLNYYSMTLFVCYAIHKIKTVFSSVDSKSLELLLFLKDYILFFKTCIRCFSLRREKNYIDIIFNKKWRITRLKILFEEPIAFLPSFRS
jgi:hypothetical protein